MGRLIQMVAHGGDPVESATKGGPFSRLKRRAVRTISGLVILLAGAAGPIAAHAGDDLAVPQALLGELNLWLDSNAEFERRESPPAIRFVTVEHARDLHGVADRSGGRLRGLYDAENRTIYLTVPWSSADPWDVSVLLHELVHHRQAGQWWFCQQEQEWRAYQIQAHWLAERQIESDFYWPAILLESSCSKRDFHAD